MLIPFILIYQPHLLDGRASAGASVDSARQNLASTFVNAFVNAGFGQVNDAFCRFRLLYMFVCIYIALDISTHIIFLPQDKLMTVPSEASSGGASTSWLFKNKEHGKASAAASLVRCFTG